MFQWTACQTHQAWGSEENRPIQAGSWHLCWADKQGPLPCIRATMTGTQWFNHQDAGLVEELGVSGIHQNAMKSVGCYFLTTGRCNGQFVFWSVSFCSWSCSLIYGICHWFLISTFAINAHHWDIARKSFFSESRVGLVWKLCGRFMGFHPTPPGSKVSTPQLLR